MLYKGKPIVLGTKINGVDIANLDPNKVRGWINSLPEDQAELIRSVIRNNAANLPDFKGKPWLTGVGLRNDYAKHAGRPSLDKLPFGRSENDGYPFLPGHDPLCDGEPYAKVNGKMVCKCKYDKWNHEGGSVKEMWPGGPDIDDFDM